MLTHEQIEVAREDNDYYSKDHHEGHTVPDPDGCRECRSLHAVRVALDAYARVAALLARWERENMDGPAWIPNVVVGELRCALEGK